MKIIVLLSTIIVLGLVFFTYLYLLIKKSDVKYMTEKNGKDDKIVVIDKIDDIIEKSTLHNLLDVKYMTDKIRKDVTYEACANYLDRIMKKITEIVTPENLDDIDIRTNVFLFDTKFIIPFFNGINDSVFSQYSLNKKYFQDKIKQMHDDIMLKCKFDFFDKKIKIIKEDKITKKIEEIEEEIILQYYLIPSFIYVFDKLMNEQNKPIIKTMLESTNKQHQNLFQILLLNEWTYYVKEFFEFCFKNEFLLDMLTNKDVEGKNVLVLIMEQTGRNLDFRDKLFDCLKGFIKTNKQTVKNILVSFDNDEKIAIEYYTDKIRNQIEMKKPFDGNEYYEKNLELYLELCDMCFDNKKELELFLRSKYEFNKNSIKINEKINKLSDDNENESNKSQFKEILNKKSDFSFDDFYLFLSNPLKFVIQGNYELAINTIIYLFWNAIRSDLNELSDDKKISLINMFINPTMKIKDEIKIEETKEIAPINVFINTNTYVNTDNSIFDKDFPHKYMNYQLTYVTMLNGSYDEKDIDYFKYFVNIIIFNFINNDKQLITKPVDSSKKHLLFLFESTDLMRNLVKQYSLHEDDKKILKDEAFTIDNTLKVNVLEYFIMTNSPNGIKVLLDFIINNFKNNLNELFKQQTEYGDNILHIFGDINEKYEQKNASKEDRMVEIFETVFNNVTDYEIFTQVNKDGKTPLQCIAKINYINFDKYLQRIYDVIYVNKQRDIKETNKLFSQHISHTDNTGKTAFELASEQNQFYIKQIIRHNEQV